MQHRDYVKAAKNLNDKAGTKIKVVAVKGDVLKESIKATVKSLVGFDWKILDEATLNIFDELGLKFNEPEVKNNVIDISKGKKSTQQGPALIAAATDIIDFLGFEKKTIDKFKKLGTVDMVKEIQSMANEINLPYKEKGETVQPDDKKSDFKPETIAVFEDNNITVNWNEEVEVVKEVVVKPTVKVEKKVIKLHEYAHLFPEMGEDDFNEVVRDMSENGYREDRPIILYNGLIADGKNRYKACVTAGIKPVFTTFKGTEDQLFKHVIALNLTRRHLTPAQRAVLAAELLPEFEKEAKKQQKGGGKGKKTEKHLRATEEAAKATGSNKDAVSTVKKIKKEDPKVFQDMKKGKTTIAQAKRETEVKSNEDKFHDAEKVLKAKLNMARNAIHDFIDAAELAELENEYTSDLDLIENSILKILG